MRLGKVFLKYLNASSRYVGYCIDILSFKQSIADRHSNVYSAIVVWRYLYNCKSELIYTEVITDNSTYFG